MEVPRPVWRGTGETDQQKRWQRASVDQPRGLDSIDRTYNEGYIRSPVANMATITAESPVPYRTFTSLLFEATPTPEHQGNYRQ